MNQTFRLAALVVLLLALPVAAAAAPSGLPIGDRELTGGLLAFWLIAFSTFVSEDLTCLAAGTLAAQGRIGFLFATAACLTGIFIGDILLFLSGRWIGRPALAVAPVRWFVSEGAVTRGSEWLDRRGAAVIWLSRFVPGMRLPTYFAAGLLGTNVARFTGYFFLAALVWTPLIVGGAALFGATVVASLLPRGAGAFVEIALVAVIGYLTLKLLLKLTTHAGRRRLVGRWGRLVHWEFWPPWAFYPPVLANLLRLAAVSRHPTAFTAVNPAMPDGGFVDESKAAILDGLLARDDNRAYVARFIFLNGGDPLEKRMTEVERFLDFNGLDYPVVLKPDAGQRGSGVAVIRHREALRNHLADNPRDCLAQEYVAGYEFGVFYVRHPDELRGKIFSVTEKRFPVLVGDGLRTLETLILDDERAVRMADFYLGQHPDAARRVPAMGERIQLVELGSHCRGAIFLDGGHIVTPELERAIDRVSRGYEGFHFGRYDIRTPSLDDFRQGKNFKVIELNGVTDAARRTGPQGVWLPDALRPRADEAFESPRPITPDGWTRPRTRAKKNSGKTSETCELFKKARRIASRP